MYKAGIAGATGYTGLELVQLIHRHPQMEVAWLTSESSAGKRFSDVHAGAVRLSADHPGRRDAAGRGCGCGLSVPAPRRVD